MSNPSSLRLHQELGKWCLSYFQLNLLKVEKEKASSEKLNNGNVRVAYSTDSVDRKVKDLRLEVNIRPSVQTYRE